MWYQSLALRVAKKYEVCARRNTSAFSACTNCLVDKKSRAKWNLISLDPDKTQNHVEQLSKCAVRRDVRIENTIPKVRLMESILRHLCSIYFKWLRLFQRSRKETFNALCPRRHMLWTHKVEPCKTYSQHSQSLTSVDIFHVRSLGGRSAWCCDSLSDRRAYGNPQVFTWANLKYRGGRRWWW